MKSDEKGSEAIVYLVDDDPDVRLSYQRLFKSWGLAVQTFASPEEFLAAELPISLPVSY